MKTLRIRDLQGLPQELLEQLSINKESREGIIMEMFEESDQPLSIDDVLVGLYNASRKIYKRETINMVLYRMVKSKYLQKVSKGAYIKLANQP